MYWRVAASACSRSDKRRRRDLRRLICEDIPQKHTCGQVFCSRCRTGSAAHKGNKGTCQTYDPPHPTPALARVALLIKSPWLLPRFKGRIIHAHKMAVHEGEIGFTLNET